MKRVVVIHGWEGHPDEGWFPWLKEQLEKKGFSVVIPAMPYPAIPKIDAWVPAVAAAVGEPTEETYFVGHSVGCQTIIRYLETIKGRVGGAVFVAGWFELAEGTLKTQEEKDIADPWYNIPINFEKVKGTTNNFTAIFSTDDPFVSLAEADKFKEHLNATIIIERDKKHFSAVDGVKKLPVVFDSVLEMVEEL